MILARTPNLPKKEPSEARARRKGGVGGNSASPERTQLVDSPAVLLVTSRTQQKSFLFLLKEKIGRAQNKKCEENFFAGWRGSRATAGLASLVGVLLKKCSNFVQKTPPRQFFIGVNPFVYDEGATRVPKLQTKTTTFWSLFLFLL